MSYICLLAGSVGGFVCILSPFPLGASGCTRMEQSLQGFQTPHPTYAKLCKHKSNPNLHSLHVCACVESFVLLLPWPQLPLRSVRCDRIAFRKACSLRAARSRSMFSQQYIAVDIGTDAGSQSLFVSLARQLGLWARRHQVAGL